jgi:hypothetical protein
MSQGYPPQQPYNQQPNGNNPHYPYNQQQPQYPPGYMPAYPQSQNTQHPQPGHQSAQPAKKKRKSLKQTWNSGTGGKCGILFASGVLLISFFVCIGTINAATSTGSPVATPQTASHIAPVATARPTKKPVPTVKPTATKVPTPKPTALPPTPVPTQLPAPTAIPTQASAPSGVNGNPWDYNFTAGNYIYSPNPAFCTYFTCVSTFWTKTNGYVAECYNGSYTHSGGISGACSRDGGVEQALWSH